MFMLLRIQVNRFRKKNGKSCLPKNIYVGCFETPLIRSFANLLIQNFFIEKDHFFPDLG